MLKNIMSKKVEIKQDSLINERFEIHLFDSEGMNISTVNLSELPNKQFLAELFLKYPTALKASIDKFYLPNEGEETDKLKEALDRLKHGKKTEIKIV